VHSTGHGAEAVEIARAIHVDLSILDLHLRGMTGIDVLTKIATEIGPLPSIMMSGQASQEETLAALRAGAFSFLRKPLEMNNLLSTVEQLIRTRLGGSGPRPHFPS
jgi:two-component system response regulator AtoC